MNSSLVNEMRKTMKTARRLWFFIRNCRKTVFRLQATSEKREKSCFGAPRNAEIQKNKVSGCPDELFFAKMNCRGAPKLEKSEKQAFGESRSSKKLKNTLSGSPEALKS